MNKTIKILKNTNFYLIKIYITEKCNLNCDYCYFRNRKNDSINIFKLKKLLSNLDLNKIDGFVISGGEPLLEWKNVKELINFLRINLNFKKEIILQTNASLLSKNHIIFIKRNNINLEIGLDGDYKTTKKHRVGINRKIYNKIINNIYLLKNNNIKYYISMTLYSNDITSVYSNFMFLHNNNFNNIDLCPVVFEKWDKNETIEAKKQFLNVFNNINKRKDEVISKEFSKKIFNKKILIIMPSGDLSFNYFCMSVPRKIRKLFYFSNINNLSKINYKNLNISFNVYNQISTISKSTYKEILVHFARLSYEYSKNEMNDIGFEYWVNIMNYKEKIEKLYSRLVIYNSK